MTHTTAPSIVFVEQTITIRDKDHQPREITAFVGVGTGLAYHPVIMADGTPGTWYSISHIQSGYGLCSLSVPTPEEAQSWIGMIGNLDVDLPTIKRMMQREGIVVRGAPRRERHTTPDTTRLFTKLREATKPMSAMICTTINTMLAVQAQLYPFHNP